MPTFQYTARTAAGEKRSGTLEAPDRRVAMAELEGMGCTPISVREGGAPAAKAVARGTAAAKPAAGAPRAAALRMPRLSRAPRTPRMRMAEMLDFTTELSDLLAAGMTLSNALQTMSSRRTGSSVDAVVLGLRDEINRGASLSDALGRFPETFPRLYVSMIRAGEASGALSEVLIRLVEHFERMRETREKVVMALIYPSFILFAGIVTVAFTMVFVIPRFAKIFEDLESTLPLPTRMLMGISSFMVDYWWALLGGGGILAVLAWRYLETAPGRARWHALQLRLPLVRGVVASGAFAQFARTLRTLLANGVHVLPALRIVEETMGNVVIARELHNARERVTDGTTISAPLAAGKIFPQLLTDMLSVGERTGDMAGALGHIARRYENQLDRNVRILMTALEPILIFAIAIVVGFVAISMLLAVFDMTSGLNVQ